MNKIVLVIGLALGLAVVNTGAASADTIEYTGTPISVTVSSYTVPYEMTIDGYEILDQPTVRTKERYNRVRPMKYLMLHVTSQSQGSTMSYFDMFGAIKVLSGPNRKQAMYFQPAESQTTSDQSYFEQFAQHGANLLANREIWAPAETRQQDLVFPVYPMDTIILEIKQDKGEYTNLILQQAKSKDGILAE
jgi:hypothetical protein